MPPLGAVLLALVVTLIATQYLKLQLLRRRYPPGPTPLPIIGNLWTLKCELRYETLMQLANTYGNIFTIWLGKTPAVVLNGCWSVRDALISHSEELSGRPITPALEEMAKGRGIVHSSGNSWKQHRRFSLMTLRNLGLGRRSLEVRIQEETKHLTEIFEMTKGNPVDPSQALVHCVSNVISAVVFGHRFSREDKEFHELVEANNFLLSFLGKTWCRLYDIAPWLMRCLPGPQQDFMRLNTLIEKFVEKEIKIHKENGLSKEPQDLIDCYLNQISNTSDDANSCYDNDNLVRTVADFFIAGTESPSTTLGWALLYMVNEPAIQEKVQKELDAVLGESKTIQWEDRKILPYTNAVIHEVQRYSNIQSAGVFRETVKETTLQGFNIVKGTIIIPNLASCHFDPDHWETPHQFNPNHFLDKDGNFVSNEAFLAFSAGHRVCLGELLARTELFIFFSSLLRAFTFKLPEGVKDVNLDYIFGLSLKPHPYKICAVPR
ncbi:hypothetical protein NDU88_000558 [Pleurodeles waltl]|uniref:Uncharacterized protein n=1 Tax=Pleurodeles waltl TaxID=8319 RepID=A0AAV7L8Q5_PLEWA|nr:hypothetical protein NDU88_000558 [Pleurodeles waltl]